MFRTADPRPRIAFLGSFGGLRPFGAELANTAFGLAYQGKGTLTPLQCRFRLSSRVQTENVASRPARTAAVLVSIGLMILSLKLINRIVFSRRRHRRRGCESGILAGLICCVALGLALY